MRAIGIFIWIDGIGWSGLVIQSLVRYIADGWEASWLAVLFVLAPFLGVLAALGSPWFSIRYPRSAFILVSASTVLLTLCAVIEQVVA